MSEATAWTMAQAATVLGSCGLKVQSKPGVYHSVIGIHPASVTMVSDDEGEILRVVSFDELASDFTLPGGDPCGVPSERPTLPTETDRKYQLTASKRQMAVIRTALESYSRLLHSQIDMVLTDAFRDRYCTGTFNHANTNFLYRQLKDMIFPDLHPNASYGVGSREYPESTVAWDIQQVIRHRLSWDYLADEGLDKPKHYGVQYNEAMAFSGEPLPVIETVESGESHPV